MTIDVQYNTMQDRSAYCSDGHTASLRPWGLTKQERITEQQRTTEHPCTQTLLTLLQMIVQYQFLFVLTCIVH